MLCSFYEVILMTLHFICLIKTVPEIYLNILLHEISITKTRLFKYI